MQEDAYLQQIDSEVNKLQNQLKTRLVQAQDLSNLNKTVMTQTFKLDESAIDLNKTAEKTKWKWFFQYAKYVAIIVGILLLLFISIFGTKIFPKGSSDKSSDT